MATFQSTSEYIRVVCNIQHERLYRNPSVRRCLLLSTGTRVHTRARGIERMVVFLFVPRWYTSTGTT